MLDGMGTPKDVVKRAKELGWGAAALTEHGHMGSAPDFYKACRAEGIKPIIGIELYVVSEEALGQRIPEFRYASYHLTALALSAEGYHNLVAWTTFANQRENLYYDPRISLQAMVEIAPYPMHHNVILTGCLSGELASMMGTNGNGLLAGAAYIKALKYIFPNLYIEVQNHARQKFMGHGFENYEAVVAQEVLVRQRLLALSEVTGTPTVLTNDSHFQTADQRQAHLTLVDRYRHEGMKGYGYFANYLQSMEKIADRTEGGEKVIENVLQIVEEADVRLKLLDDFSYSIPFSGYNDPIKKIRKRSEKRLAKLEKKHGKDARERFEMELAVMGDFAHYLLIMSDFIIHARKQGILTNTRGSAANSLVCYCLRIHNIDPMPGAYDLLFSRFVNPARKKFPDIDIDIDKDRYEDFMQYVKEYMAEREKEGQVVQICNYGTLANRSTFRLVADSLGISKDKQDEISRLLPQMIDSGIVDEESDVYEALKEEYPEIYELASGVFDQVKNISQHACGWLFGTKDRPIEDWVPLALIASSGTMVTQYNLKSLDDMGLVKGDFLRLKTLSVISRTRKIIGDDALDLSDIPLDDEKTFELLREGRTEGIFTLQGKENRRGVMEIEAASVHDVIKTVAIYRPALTREGKNTAYNNRRTGAEQVEYPHEIAERIVGKTYGIPVFQEQAMELGYAVGMSDEEVDDIYRAIKLAKGIGRGAKEAFKEIEPKFYNRALEIMSQEEADGVWNLLRSFQGYGFNKGHATSYGILAVQSAYLKAHTPAAFFTALLDVYPEKSKYIAAARGEGFQFLPPSVNESQAGFSLDRASGKIRVGLARIKDLGPVAVAEILRGQPYSSYEDFRARTTARAVNVKRVEALREVGALESFGVRADGGDLSEFYRLGFTLNKPKALRGIKPKHTGQRISDSGWHHLGRERTVELTEYRTSVSKLFWIPPFPKGDKDQLLKLKSSAMGHGKSWLLLAVDENGIAFEIIVKEEKPGDVEIIKFIARKLRGTAICFDGAVRQPFLTDSPMGFRFSGVTGAVPWIGEPQVWGAKHDAYLYALVEYHRQRKGKNDAS